MRTRSEASFSNLDADVSLHRRHSLSAYTGCRKAKNTSQVNHILGLGSKKSFTSSVSPRALIVGWLFGIRFEIGILKNLNTSGERVIQSV